MRTFIMSGLVLALATVAYADIDPATAVGVWLFDDGGGNTARDSSNFGFDGTVNGAEFEDGKFDGALLFEGGDWVSIPSTPELQIGDELTMMAYFSAADIGDWRQLIAKSDEYLLRIDPPGEGNKMSSFVKPGGNWEPRASAAVPTLDTWIHFAATYEKDPQGGANHLKLYVNGEPAGHSTRPGNITVTANPVEIGRWGGGNYFMGLIDDVAIFNVALEADDIMDIATEGLAVVLGGGLSVDPREKTATTWGALKR